MDEVVVKKRGLSWMVWVVPVIALIIGGWMLYRYYAKRGPLIEIYFKSSGGLEPKSSFIKFRDVKVGRVESIKILKKKEGVLVYARINKDVAPFLNETTKFWVVKPEIGVEKIRGLDALVSGAYIQMEATLGKHPKSVFQGLEEPPLQIFRKEGKTFVLHAKSAYSLSEGSGVYYRSVKVGTIEKIKLNSNGSGVLLYIFVKKPYDKLVSKKSRFWNLRSIHYGLGPKGLEVRFSSLGKILAGGVGFGNGKWPAKRSFWLYPTYEDAWSKSLGHRIERKNFVMHFGPEGSKLNIGDAVTFQGFRVGHVDDIRGEVINGEVQTRVLATIDVGAFDGKLKELVTKGLAARVSKKSPLLPLYELTLVQTKHHFIYHPSSFPTVALKQKDMLDLVEEILQKINSLPINKSVALLNRNLEELQKLQKSLKKILENSKTLPEDIKKSLKSLQESLQSVTKLTKGYDKDSLFYIKINALLKDIHQTAKDLDSFIKKIKTKPNALIFGD